MIASVDPVTAYVLAGGKSVRWGRIRRSSTRRIYPLGPRLDLVRGAAGNSWIVGSAGKFAAFGPVVEDVYRERGPLGGIHSALGGAPNNLSTSDVNPATQAAELNLMLALDLPFVRLEFLKHLISQARQSHAAVVVPRTNGAFAAVVRDLPAQLAEAAERSLRAGRNKIEALFAEVSTTVIDQEEFEQGGFSEEMFRNLNTTEDREAARQWASDRGPRASG